MDGDREAVEVFYAMQPLLFDGTPRTVAIAAWLHDMEAIFRICHIEARLQVPLAGRCLAVEPRFWWRTMGEPAMQGGSWADFHALLTVRYGPLPHEHPDVPGRDSEIYNDMYLERYLSFVADWKANPNESMTHYCRRFQDMMLPHIPHHLGNPVLQALYLIREGLPPSIKLFVMEPAIGVTLESMIEAIMEAEILAQLVQAAEP